MDNKLVFGITYATAIGSGLMAGLFYMFSIFIMRALDRLPAIQGIAAMQSINKTIVTPLFLIVFVGVTLASVALIGLAAFQVDGPAKVWLIVGSVSYLVLVFLLTGAYHIPRNDKLDTFNPESAEAAKYWATYVKEWTMWNHVRAIGSITTLASMIMAIRAG
jgi:uncharacterized membrane protein